MPCLSCNYLSFPLIKYLSLCLLSYIFLYSVFLSYCCWFVWIEEIQCITACSVLIVLWWNLSHIFASLSADTAIFCFNPLHWVPVSWKLELFCFVFTLSIFLSRTYRLIFFFPRNFNLEDEFCLGLELSLWSAVSYKMNSMKRYREGGTLWNDPWYLYIILPEWEINDAICSLSLFLSSLDEYHCSFEACFLFIYLWSWL